jgi:hypothetical protein
LDFRARLRAVLATRDVGALRALLRRAAHVLDEHELMRTASWPDQLLLPVMHRLVLADPRLAPHHGAARLWLEGHGGGGTRSERRRSRTSGTGAGYGSPNTRHPGVLGAERSSGVGTRVARTTHAGGLLSGSR